MHNFNYWLQDRDIKYFKEFYLLKGFVFNEQGEPKDVSEPKLDDDGRFWLIPRPGAVPGTDGKFDDRDLIRIRANSPNAGALVRQHHDRWKEFNAKQTAQKAKNAPQPTDPSFANTSPRSLMPRNTGHEVSLERQQAHFRRMEYAQKLGLDMEKARKQEYDQTINNAIAKDAIENKKPSFTKLNGATFKTFDYKRTLVDTHGKNPFIWGKLILNIWNPSSQEIIDIRAGKYDIKPTETEPELPPTAIKQTYAQPTEEEVAELAKIQDELKALNTRYKEISGYAQLTTFKQEAKDIFSKIGPLKEKLKALNQRKPAAAPPASASAPNLAMPPAVASTPPAMPPAPNQNQAGEPIPILPPKPERRKIINLTNQKDALTAQLNQLNAQEEEAIKKKQFEKADSISEKAEKLVKEIQGLVDEIAKTEQEKN